MKKRKALIIALALVMFLALPVGCKLSLESDPPAAQTTQPRLPAPQPNRGTLTGPDIYEQNVDAAFTILLSHDGVTFGGNGSGFFISPDGLAVTNHHVMDGSVAARIVTRNMREYEITGFYVYDFDNDLALIQVDTQGRSVPYMAIGNSQAMRVGEDVFTLGSPLGMHLTFSSGNLSRFIPYAFYFGIYRVYDTMQFTAPISGGNSGGPLFNDRGEVIGINSAGVSPEFGQNLNIAVRIERAVDLVHGDHPLQPLPIGQAMVPGAFATRADIIGSWIWSEGYYIFNEDGTGRRNWDALPGAFTWTLEGGILTTVPGSSWHVDVQSRDIVLISGSLFTRTADIQPIAIADFDLTGRWQWDGGYYMFNADGSGSRDWSISPGPFTWVLSSDRLSVTATGGSAENYVFSIIDANTVSIAGFVFVRDGAAAPAAGAAHQLQGAWVWRDNRHFTITFNEAGTGTNNWFGFNIDFDWDVSGVSYGTVEIDYEDGTYEDLEFQIVDANTVLFIRFDGTRYFYVRR